MSKCPTITKRKKRLNLKLKALAYLGSVCTNCGYDKCEKALDFHHVEEKLKSFSLSLGIRNCYAWERLQNEADKCIILCANCHREHHAKEAT